MRLDKTETSNKIGDKTTAATSAETTTYNSHRDNNNNNRRDHNNNVYTHKMATQKVIECCELF